MVYQNPYAGSILQAAGRGGQLELERKAKEEEDRRRNAEESKSLGQAGLGALVALAGTALTAGLGAPAAIGAGAGVAGGAGTAATAAPSLMGNIGAGLGRAGAALTSPSNLAQAAMAAKTGASTGQGVIAGLEPAARGVIAGEELAGVKAAGMKPYSYTPGKGTEYRSPEAMKKTPLVGFADLSAYGIGQPPPQTDETPQEGYTGVDDAGKAVVFRGGQWVYQDTGLSAQ